MPLITVYEGPYQEPVKSPGAAPQGAGRGLGKELGPCWHMGDLITAGCLERLERHPCPALLGGVLGQGKRQWMHQGKFHLNSRENVFNMRTF